MIYQKVWLNNTREVTHTEGNTTVILYNYLPYVSCHWLQFSHSHSMWGQYQVTLQKKPWIWLFLLHWYIVYGVLLWTLGLSPCRSPLLGQGQVSCYLGQGEIPLKVKKVCNIMLNPLPHNATFWCTKDVKLWKTWWEREKLLVTSNLPFFPQCFLPYMVLIFHFECTFTLSQTTNFRLFQT